MNDENTKFIEYLDEFKNMSELTKDNYNVLLKEIENNYLINTVPELNNEKKIKINKQITPTDITFFIEELVKNISNDNNVNDENISIKKKRKDIYDLVKEYSYMKKYPVKKNIVKSKKKIIHCNIETIEDLINLINENPYEEDTEYNIDLESLHKIKDELKQLNELIGLKKIKTSILDQLLYFIQKLHENSNDYKHMIFYGPPGTGKTEVAKILGRMYSKIGILSKNIFKKATRSDLVAGYLGQTAMKTDSLIKECLGGVLFIDEAYSLGHEDKSSDSYSKECLDTLCEALSNHKDDLIVILAGYEKELEETVFKTNIGLKSRFIWRFTMDPYDSKELFLIFVDMIEKINWTINEDVKEEWFSDKKDRFEGYGRDVESLITHVKICHGKRIYGKEEIVKNINSEDMNNGYKRFLDNKKKDNEIDRSILKSIYI